MYMTYYESNKETRIAYQKKYNTTHQDKIKVYQSKYWGQRYLKRKLAIVLTPPLSNYVTFDI